MSIVDIIIIAVLLISTVIGLFRGFIRELLSLLSWLIALYVAWTFAELGASYLVPYLPQKPLRIVAAFTGIFIVVLILGSIVSYVLYRLFAIAAEAGEALGIPLDHPAKLEEARQVAAQEAERQTEIRRRVDAMILTTETAQTN